MFRLNLRNANSLNWVVSWSPTRLWRKSSGRLSNRVYEFNRWVCSLIYRYLTCELFGRIYWYSYRCYVKLLRLRWTIFRSDKIGFEWRFSAVSHSSVSVCVWGGWVFVEFVTCAIRPSQKRTKSSTLSIESYPERLLPRERHLAPVP